MLVGKLITESLKRASPCLSVWLVALAAMASAADPADLEKAKSDAARDPKNVRLQIELAKTALRYGDPTEALRAAGAALTLAPENDEAKSLTAKTQIYVGRLEEGLKTYESLPEGARRLNGVDGTAGAARRILEADKVFSQAKTKDDVAGYRRAVQLLSEAVKADPAIPGLEEKLGWLHLEILHEPHLAYPHLAEAYRSNPDDLDVAKLLAQAAVDFGRFGEAADLYEKILAAEPRNVDAKIGLARARIGGGEREAGLTLLEEVLQSDPENAAALRALADARSSSSKQTPSDLTTAEARRLATQAESAIERGDFRAAVESLEQAVALEPRSFYLHQTLGYLYLEKLHRPQTAYRHLAFALRLKPGDLDTLKLLGVAAFQKGCHCDAIGLLCSALARDPSDLYIRATLGRAYARAKQYAAATDQLNYVLSRDPNHVTARQGTAEVAAWRGKTDQPMRIAQSLVNENPGNTEARNLLGDLYRWDWDFRDAAAQYRSTLAYDGSNSVARTGLYEIDKATSFVSSGDGWQFVDNFGFDRRFVGSSLRIPVFDRTYVTPRYVDWQFTQGPININRRDAIVDIEHHFSRQLQATTRWLGFDYSGRDMQSAVSTTFKYQPLTAVSLYASASANEPGFLTDIGIPRNNIRMNNYGLGYDVEFTQRLSTQGTVSYADYSDDNDRRFGSVQGSYKIFPCGKWYLRLLYEELSFTGQVPTYFSPNSFGIIRPGLDITQPMYRSLNFLGKFEALDVVGQGWGYAVKFGPSAVIRDRLELRGSYFNLLVPGGTQFSGHGFDFYTSWRF